MSTETGERLSVPFFVEKSLMRSENVQRRGCAVQHSLPASSSLCPLLVHSFMHILRSERNGNDQYLTSKKKFVLHYGLPVKENPENDLDMGQHLASFLWSKRGFSSFVL